MSDKMECPGCGAFSSSVLIKVRDGEPCPFCGLSADAILEINDVRRKKADDDLKDRLSAALVELDRVKTEVTVLREQVANARIALGCVGAGCLATAVATIASFLVPGAGAFPVLLAVVVSVSVLASVVYDPLTQKRRVRR